MTESASRPRIIEETPAYWRVVFDNPPLNIMDADMFEGLQDLLGRMDTSPSLRVVVFESANPDFYLAHFEVKDTARTLTLLQTVGPSGLPSLLDTDTSIGRSRTRSWTASWMHSRAELPASTGAPSQQRKNSSTTSRCQPPRASLTASRRSRRR